MERCLVSPTRLTKHFVSAVFGRLGKQIVNRVARNGRPANMLQIAIDAAILRDGVGAVIQVGANDGLLDDPLRHILTERSLPVLFVEPLPDRFRELRRNTRAMANVVFENVAIGTKSGTGTLYRLRDDVDGLPDWFRGVASFDRRVLLKHKSWGRVARSAVMSAIEEVEVPVITFGQLLDKHPDIGRIMALQVDTEGHDAVVVESAIAAGCAPRVIQFEHRHLRYDSQWKIRDLLTSQGYGLVSDVNDTLAFREA